MSEHVRSPFSNLVYYNGRLLSQLLYSWVTPILKVGRYITFDQQLHFYLRPAETAEVIFGQFTHFWSSLKSRRGGLSLAASVYLMMWKKWLSVGTIALVRNIMYLSIFAYLRRLIVYFENNNSENFSGLVWLLGIIVQKLVLIILEGHLQKNKNINVINIRTALRIEIINKILKLSLLRNERYTHTKILNYFGKKITEISKVGALLPESAAISHILLGFIILILITGWASVIIILLFSMMSLLLILISKREHQQEEELENIVEKNNEWIKTLFKGLKFIKHGGHEDFYLKRSIKLKKEEINIRRGLHILKSLKILVDWLIMGFALGALITIGTYNNRTFKADVIFPVLFVMMIIRESFLKASQIWTCAIRALIYLEQIEIFLRAEEVDSEVLAREAMPAEKLALSVKEASYSWSKSANLSDPGRKPTLKNINLEVKIGELVAIIGSNSSGKSSLLQGLLGELLQLHTDFTNQLVYGSVAYIGPHPWILNQTVMENILLGKSLDLYRYNKVLKLTLLDEDIRDFPEKENTIIGLTGYSLTKEQKVRIALARALYANADMYFLDDIFR